MVRKAPKKAAPVAKKKAADPLFPARPRNFRIGGDIRVRTQLWLGAHATRPRCP